MPTDETADVETVIVRRIGSKVMNAGKDAPETLAV
jgi:hypothetical protein